MPARLFEGRNEEAREAALRATLASLNSVLAEPIEDCLLSGPGGKPCVEAKNWWPLGQNSDFDLLHGL